MSPGIHRSITDNHPVYIDNSQSSPVYLYSLFTKILSMYQVSSGGIQYHSVQGYYCLSHSAGYTIQSWKGRPLPVSPIGSSYYLYFTPPLDLLPTANAVSQVRLMIMWRTRCHCSTPPFGISTTFLSNSPPFKKQSRCLRFFSFLLFLTSLWGAPANCLLYPAVSVAIPTPLLQLIPLPTLPTSPPPAFLDILAPPSGR